MEKGKKRRHFYGSDRERLERNIREAIERFGWLEVEQTIVSNNPQWVILVEYIEKQG